MVNTELEPEPSTSSGDYNILNIVVNTEHTHLKQISGVYYNILNIVVNTELIEE